MQLVHERLAPADDVARAATSAPRRGGSASETSTVRKPRARSPSSRKTWSSFMRSMSNASEPFVPFTSHWNAFRRPSASRVASIVPTAPSSNSTAASTASSTSRPGTNVRDQAADRRDLADEVPREIDHVRCRDLRALPSRRRQDRSARRPRRRAPVLEVAAAEVDDVAELARLEQLPSQAHGRHEAVVERAHVLDAGRGDRAPDLVALVRRPAQRLLAHDVLPRLSGRKGRLRVDVVGPAVVEQLDALVGDQLVPVRRPRSKP